MIDNDKLIAAIKTYLPEADNAICERMADEIKRDIDATILSMVRQAVAQQRKDSFMQSSK